MAGTTRANGTSASAATRLGRLVAAALLASPAVLIADPGPSSAAPASLTAPSGSDLSLCCLARGAGSATGHERGGVDRGGELDDSITLAQPVPSVTPRAARALLSRAPSAPRVDGAARILLLAPKTSPPGLASMA